MYELPPGESSSYHWHVGEEELLLVLEGEPTLRTPDGETRVRPWDVAVFRRGEAGAHQLRNDTEEKVRAAFFSSVSDPEVAVYPDQDKISVVAGRSRDDMATIRGWLGEQK